MHQLICRGQQGSIPGVSMLLSGLLLARGITNAQEAQAFLQPTEEGLSDPFLLAGMAKACEIIHHAIQDGRKIVIYGDYDCDGVCASAILQEAIASLGGKAQVYIPSRHEEGYGLNCDAVRRLAAPGALLLTVDCGVTAVEEVALARELGMQVIVTDHHTLPESPPCADVLLHPTLGSAPCTALCGAGLSYKLACALTGKRLLPSLELAALATIADMVPLLGENRVLAALGLQKMPDTPRPGLQALMHLSGIEHEVSSMQAAFLLAPRINACGRMATADIALRLLTTRDPAQGQALAQEADALNAKRKNIEQRILEQAEAQVKKQDLYALRAIVVAGEDWESGVVGLVAGRLAERYGYPTVALSRQGDTYVGSARSACGVDLYQALCDCGDIFLRFGGHKQAAGLTIHAENCDLLTQRFSDAVARQRKGRALMPETYYDAVLPLSDISLPLIAEIRRLEPFGMSNPAPVYLLENADVLSARAVGADKTHLKLTLSQNGALCEGIGFHLGARAGTLWGACELAVTPVANTFRGQTHAECRIEAIGRAHARFPEDHNEESQAILQDFSQLWRIKDSYSVNTVRLLPAPEGAQGTLYLCRTGEGAQGLCQMYPNLDILSGTEADPRAYNAVWLCDGLRFCGPYRRVVLCEGLLCPQEAALLHQLYPEAEILALPRSAALAERLERLRFSVQELRAAYVRLKAGQRLDRTDARQAAMGKLLMLLELLSAEGQLLPMRRCDPAAHPFYQLIQGSEIHGYDV